MLERILRTLSRKHPGISPEQLLWKPIRIIVAVGLILGLTLIALGLGFATMSPPLIALELSIACLLVGAAIFVATGIFGIHLDSWNGGQEKTAVRKYLTRIPSNSALLLSDGERRFIGDEEIYLWRWDPLAIWVRNTPDQIVRLRYPRLSIGLKLSPITSNPKVRDMVIHVAYQVKKSAETCIALSQMYGRDWSFDFEKEFNTWLRSQMFELNERRSSALAEFYDPAKHTKEVDRIVREFLEPLMPERWRPHIHLDSVRFDHPILTGS